jgi:hypothetical protein
LVDSSAQVNGQIMLRGNILPSENPFAAWAPPSGFPAMGYCKNLGTLGL